MTTKKKKNKMFSIKIRAKYNEDKTELVLTLSSPGPQLTAELVVEALGNYAYMLDLPSPEDDNGFH